jgi:hypothetical protein
MASLSRMRGPQGIPAKGGNLKKKKQGICPVEDLQKHGWGARIRTWAAGSKVPCLTTWLRPILKQYIF